MWVFVYKIFITGLLLVSPAVLIDFDNYMNRVLFKEAKLMAEGKAVKHPMVDPADQIIIKFDSLSDYVEVL